MGLYFKEWLGNGICILNSGQKVKLLTPSEFKATPDGTVLYCISGEVVVKGKDYIDYNTRNGYLAYGVKLAFKAKSKT